MAWWLENWYSVCKTLNLIYKERGGSIARPTFSIIKEIEVGSLSSGTVEGIGGSPNKLCARFVF